MRDPSLKSRPTARLRAEFPTLHASNAVRFGLRPLELAAWPEKVRRTAQAR